MTLIVPTDFTAKELGTVEYVESRGSMVCLLIRPKDYKPYYVWLRQGETCNFLGRTLPDPPQSEN